MFDWQNVTVALIILAACLYVGRRVWARLRSLGGARDGQAGASCATGCGACGGDDKTEQRAATPPAKVLVQIGRANSATTRQAR